MKRSNSDSSKEGKETQKNTEKTKTKKKFKEAAEMTEEEKEEYYVERTKAVMKEASRNHHGKGSSKIDFENLTEEQNTTYKETLDRVRKSPIVRDWDKNTVLNLIKPEDCRKFLEDLRVKYPNPNDLGRGCWLYSKKFTGSYPSETLPPAMLPPEFRDAKRYNSLTQSYNFAFDLHRIACRANGSILPPYEGKGLECGHICGNGRRSKESEVNVTGCFCPEHIQLVSHDQNIQARNCNIEHKCQVCTYINQVCTHEEPLCMMITAAYAEPEIKEIVIRYKSGDEKVVPFPTNVKPSKK